jgi:signal transduction histidine kinase
VNNAIKHSAGRRILIRLAAGDAGIELKITDNGKGLRQVAGRPGGMGLHIMDYRARSIGGNLNVTSEPNGTTVVCRLPQK